MNHQNAVREILRNIQVIELPLSSGAVTPSRRGVIEKDSDPNRRGVLRRRDGYTVPVRPGMIRLLEMYRLIALSEGRTHYHITLRGSETLKLLDAGIMFPK